jgi:predicted transposase/invertase (TIGR01784 family)
LHTVQLKNQNNKLFYDKLIFVYLTLPNFTKTEQELNSNQDKWLYFFKNLAYCDDIPDIYKKDKLFEDIFEKAKIAKFNHQEQDIYLNSLKEYLDWFNTFQTAKDEAEAKGEAKGIIKGLAQGKAEGELQAKLTIAKNLKNLNLPIENIIQATGLTKEQIEEI